MSAHVDQPRTPAGSPQGGQFDFKPGAEAGIHLAVLDHNDIANLTTPQQEQEQSWGEVTLRPSHPTPWGSAQQVEQQAPGIVFVSTASHGGYKLSPERQRAVPAALRRPNGWYEEDCEAYIVHRTFPDVFATPDQPADYWFHVGDRGVQRWFGREWAHVTGNPVPRETLEREQEQARREAQLQAEHDALPDAPTTTVDASTLDLSQLTPNQRKTVQKDLSQLWRDKNGSITSTRDVLKFGVSGVRQGWDGNRRTYTIVKYTKLDQQGNPHGPYEAYSITKTTFDTLTGQGGLTDTTTPHDRAMVERQATRHALDKVERDIVTTQRIDRYGSTTSSRNHLRQLEDRKLVLERRLAETEATIAATEEP